MEDKIKPLLEGRIIITHSKDGVIFDKHNAIGNDALVIVCKCLSQMDGVVEVDTMKAEGNFSPVSVTLDLTEYDNNNNTMLFRATLLENAFNGTMTNLYLLSQSLGGAQMAKKNDLSIFKDDTTRLQIDWLITIN